MKKNTLYTLLITIIGSVIAISLLFSEPKHISHDDHDDHGEATEEIAKGPQGGRLLTTDDFSLEITLYEKGVPPEFHLYSYHKNKLIDPADVKAEIFLTRLDGQVDKFNFKHQNNYLQGDAAVTEPHSFNVDVRVSYDGKTYQWQYENHEGRVQISNEIAHASGIKTDIAKAHTIKKSLKLTGRVQIDPNRLSKVRARFPGVVKRVKRELGEHVKKGDVLVTIQSNESLQTYQIKAPISGVIIQRDIQVGEVTTDAALYTIADLSIVWAELDVFNKDIALIQPGQSVELETHDNSKAHGKISWLSPMVAHASQSIQARIVLDNPELHFRPGQFIRGLVIIGEHKAALAVRKSAIQSFRDFQVVYARINDEYEVRMLELGQEDSEWIEVLSGLKHGAEYVTENSFLIKADIEKSGASHDH